MLPELFDRAEARAAGLTDRQIDRRLRVGRFRPVRRGLLTAATTGRSASAENGGRPDSELALLPLLLRWRAAVRRGPGGLVASHHLAAQAWGLPTPLGDPLPLRFTRRPDGRASTRYYQDFEIEVASLASDDIVRAGGLLLTSPARTVADCLRHLPGRDALAIADAAVAHGLTDAAEIADVLERCGQWPGAGLAARLLPLVDGRRESPLESWSAVAFDGVGLPAPEPQVELLDARGRLVARVDSWWTEGVAGEADGRTKYLLGAARAGGATDTALAEVVHAERRREADVRALGVEVERWGAADVLDPGRLARLAVRIRRAQAVAAGRGVVVHTRRTPAPRRRCSPNPPLLALEAASDGGYGEQ